tara:strand:+ start:420 stop:1061 length:642 start_codon:yes stop_codon:yes gene_type:complete
VHIVKVFILLFFSLSCNNDPSIKNIYINKTQKIQVQGNWDSEYKISYLWLKPVGPNGHQAKWIINDDIMLFTPDKIGIYSITVSIEDNMGNILGEETFLYNAISKKHSTQQTEQSNNNSNLKKEYTKVKKNEVKIGGHTVQISSWNSLQEAEKHKKEINNLGFNNAYINQKNINGKVLYRVRIGKNLSYNECIEIKNQLAKQNINNVWIDKNK